MDEKKEQLAARFEKERPRLRAVAYRMLGSLGEADDAVQEAWLRLSGAEAPIDDLSAWLTTVVSRLALNVLRLRKRARVPDAILDPVDSGPSAEHALLFSASVGLALLVVLETLAPAERVAFVLHDVFEVPFEAIAPIVERTPEATRQLASRARRRVEERRAVPDADVAVQRSVVDAFLEAAHVGDVSKIVAVLAPDVFLRADVGTGEWMEASGAEEVARRSQSYSRTGLHRYAVLVNGAVGAFCTKDGEPFAVMAFTVVGGKIVDVTILRDLSTVAAQLAPLEGPGGTKRP